MFYKYSSVLFVLNVLVFCDSGFVDTLTKCSIRDRKCGKKLLQKLMPEIASTGIPEIGVPPLDPLALNNITMKILDAIEITLIEGHAKGLKNCVIDKFESNIENKRTLMEFTCDVTVKGKYKLFSSSPMIKSLLGAETVQGEGTGKVKIEKINLNIEFFFYIEKRDGELYIMYEADKTKYDFDVKGKVTFFADRLFIGDVESSKQVVALLNQNWRLLMSSFGKPFMDEAMTYVYTFMHKFFGSVPLKYYIIEDLSSYARD